MERAHLIYLVFLNLMISVFHFHCVDAQAGSLSYGDRVQITISITVLAFLIIITILGFIGIYFSVCIRRTVTRIPLVVAAVDLCRGNHHIIIDKCPILDYSTAKDLKHRKGELDCAVCLNEFEECDIIRLLPNCHHIFHLHCIDEWLLSKLTCPVCRTKVTPDTNDTALNIITPESNDQNDVTATEVVAGDDTAEIIEEGQSSRTGVTDSEVRVVRVTPQEPDTALTETFSPHQLRMLNRFPRSHSTGHSLAELEERLAHVDRYTLVGHGRVHRLTTGDEVLPGAWSSKSARCISDRNDIMKRWSFPITPFVFSSSWRYCGSLTDNADADNVAEVGDELQGRMRWTPLRMSLCKVEGPQQPSHFPYV